MPSAERRERKKANAQAAREARQKAQRRSKQLRTARNVAIAVAGFVVLFLVLNALLGGNDDKQATDTTAATTPTTTAVAVSAPDFELTPGKQYTATISTNFGDIVVALDTERSPVAAGHFIKMANDGVYTNSRWHRIVKDSVIQGGAPGGDKSADGPSSLVGEVPTDNYPLGVIAAAKTATDPAGTFDSQFFIVTGQAQGSTLPNEYARFGIVTTGLEIVKQIESLPVDAEGEPTEPALINSVTITES